MGGSSTIPSPPGGRQTSVYVGIPQAKRIDEAKVGSFEVDVTPPATVVELLKRLEDFVATANEATDAAAAARREAAQLLRKEGLPIRDVGELIGVSHQRVSQILAS